MGTAPVENPDQGTPPEPTAPVENPGQEPKQTEEKPPRTIEDLEKELKATREESKRHRLERNALREKQELGAKTTQTEADRIANLEKEVLNSRREAVAASAGLPIELIQGSTREQLEESAQQVSELIAERVQAELQKQEPPVMPVVPGENAGGAPLQDGDWLRNMLNKK